MESLIYTLISKSDEERRDKKLLQGVHLPVSWHLDTHTELSTDSKEVRVILRFYLSKDGEFDRFQIPQNGPPTLWIGPEFP